MLTEKELLLLNALRADCRSNFSKLSNEIGLSVSTLFTKLKKLEKAVIHKHTVLLDYKKIGYPIRNHFIIEVRDAEKFKNSILNHFNVNSISFTENRKYYIDCFFKDFKEMDDFVSQMEENSIAVKKVVHVIDGIKEEGFEVR